MTASKRGSGFVVCVDNTAHPASLKLHKIYRMLLDENADLGDVRVVDESGEDYIYPAEYFAAFETTGILHGPFSAGKNPGFDLDCRRADEEQECVSETARSSTTMGNGCRSCGDTSSETRDAGSQLI